jgi:hypothetical protein
MRTLFVCLLATAAALQAETYKLTLAQRSEVAGKELEAGDYKLDVEQGVARFHKGKNTLEVPVRSEQCAAMATHTLIGYDTTGPMYRVKSVEIKGTLIRLLF